MNPSVIFCLADRNSARHALPLLEKAGIKGKKIILPAGEQTKDIRFAEKIWEFLMTEGGDKKSLLLNVGGGVITDLGGFSASLFKRGIHFIHIPTTLLGMVDGAIGGKTGINFKSYKNHLGTFSEPDSIHIFSPFCETLSQRVFRSGLAEMLKHFLIADRNQFLQFEKISQENINLSIQRAIRIKMEIVKKDMFDLNERQKLNVGHTIGHALESFFLQQHKRILHGEAVASGLYHETRIAMQLGILNPKEGEKIISILKQHFHIHSKINLESLMPYIFQDKKNMRGAVYMSLPEWIGSVIPRVKVEIKDILNTAR